VALQAANGILHLHNKRLVHLDIKPDNGASTVVGVHNEASAAM
jgi:serine/threonine protein kinase